MEVNLRRIIKVKITKEKKIHITYEIENKIASWDEYSFTCLDEAIPEFYCALNMLAYDVIELCELPDEYVERIDVKGVSFSYGGEKEVMGATISACMLLNHSNCPLSLNTPHKPSESYNDITAAEDQILSDITVQRLNDLIKQCKKYIDGERAQTDLFLQNKGKQ
ncbi:MAG: hypothetical protein KJN62_01495 [Deltaproteobacteria bacterium]|nr:hypothetical protein [Deltaproteobacteria bacterium]